MSKRPKQRPQGLAGFLNSRTFVALSLAGFVGIVLLGSRFPQSQLLGLRWFDVAIVWFCASVVAALAGSWMERAKEKKRSDDDSAQLRAIPDDATLRITEVESGDNLGELKAEYVRWLVEHHVKAGLEANGFFFLPELLDMFVAQESPPAPIVEFLRKAMAGRESMELRWERRQ